MGGGDDGFLEAIGGNGAGNVATKAAISGLPRVRRPDILLLSYERFLKINNAFYVRGFVLSAVNTISTRLTNRIRSHPHCHNLLTPRSRLPSPQQNPSTSTALRWNLRKFTVPDYYCTRSYLDSCKQNPQNLISPAWPRRPSSLTLLSVSPANPSTRTEFWWPFYSAEAFPWRHELSDDLGNPLRYAESAQQTKPAQVATDVYSITVPGMFLLQHLTAII